MRAYVHVCVKERGRGREVEREVGGERWGKSVCVCEDPQGQQLSLHSFPRLRGQSVSQCVCVGGGALKGSSPA